MIDTGNAYWLEIRFYTGKRMRYNIAVIGPTSVQVGDCFAGQPALSKCDQGAAIIGRGFHYDVCTVLWAHHVQIARQGTQGWCVRQADGLRRTTSVGSRGQLLRFATSRTLDAAGGLAVLKQSTGVGRCTFRTLHIFRTENSEL